MRVTHTDNLKNTHVSAFHVMNRETKRKLNVDLIETSLDDTATPDYRGIHLDRTLSHKRQE